MKNTSRLLKNEIVTLEPATQHNLDRLVKWTLDPVAQGAYKRVPQMSAEELGELFLHSNDRHYFLITRTEDQKHLGRYYHRAWHFTSEPEQVDWELNILLAKPSERGKGYGTAVQKLATDYLLDQPTTRSVFAYTFETNIGERRALEKAGFEEAGYLPHPHYKVNLPPEKSMLYVKYPA